MRLRECFDSLNGSGMGASVKFANFFDVYDQHFYHIRDRIKTVLEVGVEGGGSLALWQKYFPNIRKVVGIDTHDSCKCWSRDGVKVYIGDASDRAFMEAVCDEEGDFDLVIDDGSHRAEHQRGMFDIMFPHVTDNGWYIIEDTQCSYWERLGGGYCKDGVIEFCKHLSDCVTWWALQAHDTQAPEMVKYNGQVRGVHFHPAAVFIEKGPERSHNLHYAFSDPKEQKAWEEGHPNVYA